MSKKGIVKKAFALLTVLAMVIGVSVSVSAEVTHSTSTSYNMIDNTVSVDTNVYNLENGQQITYLAYNQGADITASDIIYIDQRTSDGTSPMLFEYTTAVDKINNTLVKCGTDSATNTVTNDGSAEQLINTYTVTATVGSKVDGAPVGGTVALAEISESGKALGGADCELDITPDADFEISSITRNGASVSFIAQADVTKVPIANITAATDLVVYFSPVDTEAIDNAIADASAFTAETDLAAAKKMLTTFSKATTKKDEVTEFGILFYYNESAFTALQEAIADVENPFDLAGFTADNVWGNIETAGINGINKYRALGKGAKGEFAVKLMDTSDTFLGRADATEYITRPYLVLKSGEIKFGNPTTFTIGEGE